MGLLLARLSTLFSSFGADEQARILMLGLDAAGKTTILYKIKLNENVCTIPTIGFNVETVQPHKGISFTVWDVGGQDKIRKLWEHYFPNTEGLIYVIDSSDRERFKTAKYELFKVLERYEINDVPVVIIANKQDLPGAATPAELITALGMQEVNNRKWYVQAACAMTGDGIYESMEILAGYVKDFKSQHRHR